MWLRGLVRRRTLRLAGAAVGVALAVALFASLGTFFSASKARMTQEASRGVPVDWQVLLAQGANVPKAERIIARAPGVLSALPVGYADVTKFTSSTAGTVQVTGVGKALGLPPNYATTFSGVIRYLVGARSGVLLAQQAAANLHVAPGTTITLGRPGQPPVKLKVDGVVDLPTADSLFQAIGVLPGAAPTAPPDNVVLLPAAMWHQLFDPVAKVRPDTVRTQVHVDLSSALPPDPGASFVDVLGRAHNLESQLAGTGLVGNNLGAQLDAARADAIYAQLLFVFLGLPGIVLGALLTAVVAASGRERRRQEQALLRLRGASPQRITRLAAGEAALAGVVGSGLGLAGAALAGRMAFGTSRLGATLGQTIVWTVASVAFGLALAAVTVLLPAWRDARTLTVRAAQATVSDPGKPLWARLYLDVLLLGGAGLVFWQAVKSGYQVVLAPEGVATISVSYFTLLAPLLLWVGSALFTWRLARGILARGGKALARAARPVAHGLSGVVAASMVRQRRLLSRGLVIMALTGSFALSTAVFNTTYAAQARVDAELTNGADVAATTTATGSIPAGALAKVRALPAVVNAQPMQHRFAYVGNDLQDMFGIDPSTIGQATNISDAFFAGGHASQVLAALARRPDAVLVSDETVRDFQLQPGDLIRLRMQFASDNAYHIVPFHYVGIVREFPTAPRDSFFVANASYVAKATGSPAYQTLLIKTNASPPAVASQVRNILGPTSGARVQDIVTELRVTLSGLTAIDLSGLTRLELAFAIILAVAASGLVLALGLAERRRMFAIASALGARSRQLAAFVWSEAAYVTLGGLVLGALAGWGISFVIVKILTGVFDPPPQHLFIPLGYLAVVVGVTVLAVIAAGAAMVRATRTPAVEILRDL
ncbi:MAG: FtsX-like permease family protein [Actinomycetota bacterium]|nr:FtsX-like permease family protein [Actinomycetota bacterium]